MSHTAQTIVTLLLVGWAMVYLLWRVVRSLRSRSGGCASGCSHCPTKKADGPEVISVESLLSNSPRR